MMSFGRVQMHPECAFLIIGTLFRAGNGGIDGITHP